MGECNTILSAYTLTHRYGVYIRLMTLKNIFEILCVRMQTPTAAIYGEVGRYSLIVHRKIAIMKCWQ